MADEVLVCVDPAKLDQIWPHVKHFIHAAFLTGIGDDNADSIKTDLDAGHSFLWVVWDGEELLAAVTTKLVKTASKKLCVVTSCAGRELHRWNRLIADIEKYARDESCDAVRIMGRHGWAKILPEYHQPWLCLEKELRE